MIQQKIINRLHALGIEELKSVQSLNELNGDFINIECIWPNGTIGQILDDNRKYYGTQVEKSDSERCYGIAADENQIAVFEYGCAGKEAELVMWVKM